MSEGNGVNGVAVAEEPVRQIAEAKKLTKLDIKRMQAHEERRRRLINSGVSPEKVDSVIAAEDYSNLSVEKKMERLEKVVSRALQGFQQDIMALRHNDGVIADAMDINLKALARGLQKAGVTLEQQNEIIKAVEVELREEQRQEAEARALASKAAAEAREKATMEQEAATKPTVGGDEAEPQDTPDGATVFEG